MCVQEQLSCFNRHIAYTNSKAAVAVGEHNNLIVKLLLTCVMYKEKFVNEYNIFLSTSYNTARIVCACYSIRKPYTSR